MPKRKHENPVVNSESDSPSTWSSLDEVLEEKAKAASPSTKKTKQANSSDKRTSRSFSFDEDEFLLDIVLDFQERNGIGSNGLWPEVKRKYDAKFGKSSEQLRSRYRVLAKRPPKVTNGVEKNTKVEHLKEEAEEANN
ncbi:uncharacterized protein SPPG_00162 [Spizellomyces punctatus DAOM BR117]|uniref:Myb-like domain-containing protein n=1 Tax=Spizellomyces punctatus (strain DAOM BR117) TaxID=645134 RepID=A0A0L0HTJ2_SPIPD|nr:uncharacterized protein SPPG_00162 [Spizellomyces punctatus DAOM BR117]KND04433.1 hypothetical protein SPPG_00162 [Spizellomyces punctatus DAOM BR117]|eukprot:XP_016612472.1 hypothetical protein SPPG_00162 [Spizellomyces punctatus DAOM BR117]